MFATIITLLVILAQQEVRPPIKPGDGAPCAVSEDPSYGYTVQNPVQIGGGALYVKARETRYLDALRGPEGQPIRYRRVGSLPQNPPNGTVILDEYEVTYDGLDKPLRLYLNAYHYWRQDAPKGLTCAQPFRLQPILDEFLETRSVQALALEQGAAREFAPIPLARDDTSARGVMWDMFRNVAASAREAAAKGRPLSPLGLGQRGLIVLAYPLACGERSVRPSAIDIVSAQGPPVQQNPDRSKDAGLQVLLAASAAPDGSLAVSFPLHSVRPGDSIRIAYDGPACAEGTTQFTLPATSTPARPIEMPDGTLPAGVADAEKRVLLQAVIDLEGAFRQATFAGGPAQLAEAAIDTLKSWRAEPARVNGTPVVSSTLLEVRFK
jgi:hypothetical protein